MRQFMEMVQRSILDPIFYREIPLRSLGPAFKYFFTLTFALALVMTVLVSIILVPAINGAVQKLPDGILASYPDDLEIRLEDGRISTNLPGPIVIPTPEPIDALFRSIEITQFAVIDTTTPFTVDQFNEFHVVFWVLSDSIATRDTSGNVTINKLPVHPEAITMTERDVNAFLAEMRGYIPFVAPLAAFVVFLIYYLVNIAHLAYLFVIGAPLIFVLSRLLKQPLSYGGAYRVGLYAMTVPLILDTGLTYFGMPLLGLPFSFSLIMLVMVYLNLRPGAIPPPVPAPTAPPASSSIPEIRSDVHENSEVPPKEGEEGK